MNLELINNLKIRKAVEEGKFEIWNSDKGELFGCGIETVELIKKIKDDCMLSNFSENDWIIINELIKYNIVK